MAEKYRALEALGDSTARPGTDRQTALRACSSRWPASLREAELVAPERIAVRRRASATGARAPVEARQAWRARGEHAIVLWATAHELIRDVRALERPSGGRRRVGPLAARYARWRPPAALGVDALPELVGDRPSSRTAYLWLAFTSGFSLAGLFRVLFARSGHWDRRPGDPLWASHEVG
jgi:hypothetical protein